MATKKPAAKRPAAAKKTSRKPAQKSAYIKVSLKGLSIAGKEVPLAVLLAEFIGTFLLVGTVFAVQGQPLYVGLGIVGIVLGIGAISGGHINPLVTFGAWITGKIGALRGLGYVLFQALGALAAYATLSAFLKGVDTASFFSQPELFQAGELTEGKEWYILFAELLGAAILAFGVAAALKAKDVISSAFSAGLAVLVALLIAGSVTASFLLEANSALTFVNPAVALAGHAQSFSWELWPISIYLVAPLVGGAIGFVFQDILSRNKK